MDLGEALTFTVDEFIRHLMWLRKEKVITGKEELVDIGFFGLSHVHVEKDHFIMLQSQEIEDAQNLSEVEASV